MGETMYADLPLSLSLSPLVGLFISLLPAAADAVDWVIKIQPWIDWARLFHFYYYRLLARSCTLSLEI